ncbi:hypothetical protein [Lysinibacillus sp. NPDC086135]|uniref:hypothetical protein n=1 Tax=Lysinibacillus sp. NPDC086135 TaxID=3364130 RepID=UPI00382C875A
MKEVYVITCGCYSDYGIECIFTDIDKANKYVELKNNSGGDEYRVEVYPLDEIVFDSSKIIEVKAMKELNNDEYEFNYKIIDVVDEDFDVNRTWVDVEDYSHKKSSKITLRRKFKGDEINVVNKYKKVIEDYFFKVEANWDLYKTYEGRKLIEAETKNNVDSIK